LLRDEQLLGFQDGGSLQLLPVVVRALALVPERDLDEDVIVSTVPATDLRAADLGSGYTAVVVEPDDVSLCEEVRVGLEELDAHIVRSRTLGPPAELLDRRIRVVEERDGPAPPVVLVTTAVECHRLNRGADHNDGRRGERQNYYCYHSTQHRVLQIYSTCMHGIVHCMIKPLKCKKYK
jgi:hypothetical protein